MQNLINMIHRRSHPSVLDSFFEMISINRRYVAFDMLEDFASEINILTGIDKYLVTFDCFMGNATQIRLECVLNWFGKFKKKVFPGQ